MQILRCEENLAVNIRKKFEVLMSMKIQDHLSFPLEADLILEVMYVVMMTIY